MLLFARAIRNLWAPVMFGNLSKLHEPLSGHKLNWPEFLFTKQHTQKKLLQTVRMNANANVSCSYSFIFGFTYLFICFICPFLPDNSGPRLCSFPVIFFVRFFSQSAVQQQFSKKKVEKTVSRLAAIFICYFKNWRLPPFPYSNFRLHYIMALFTVNL